MITKPPLSLPALRETGAFYHAEIKKKECVYGTIFGTTG